jgi:hypothetical protein
MICRLKYFVLQETYTEGVVVVGRGGAWLPAQNTSESNGIIFFFRQKMPWRAQY